MYTVAFISDAPRVAGSEVWLRDLLPLLPGHGWTPTVFFPHQPALERLIDDLCALGVGVEQYSNLSELPARTRAFDLRVIQAWEAGTSGRLLPQLRVPRVVVSHDQLDYHYPLPIQGLYRTIYRYTKAAAFRQADAVITVSDWGSAFLRQQMKLTTVLGMVNGVDTQQFAPAEAQQRRALRERLDFGRFTVLVPGRFAPEKNQLAALWTARHAPELDFVFVGDMDSALGNVAQAMQRRWQLPNVRFLGRRWDMPDLYRAADVLLQPTLAENQSLVTLEAMSSGLPVVTTGIPAQTELIRDGVDGLCVPPQPFLLATALGALASHPDKARVMGQCARQRVLAEHTTAQSAFQLAQLFGRCMDVPSQFAP